MSTILYKAVKIDLDHPGSFYSMSAVEPLTRRYRIGEKATSQTPLFVFLNKQAAIEEIIDQVPRVGRHLYAILEGYCEGERPFQIRDLTRKLPTPGAFSRSEDEKFLRDIQSFWDLRKLGLNSGINLSLDVKDAWYGTYAFTPRKVHYPF